MISAGILDETDRVQLIDGEFIQPTTIGRRHAACVSQLTRRLMQALGDRALMWARTRSACRARAVDGVDTLSR